MPKKRKIKHRTTIKLLVKKRMNLRNTRSRWHCSSSAMIIQSEEFWEILYPTLTLLDSSITWLPLTLCSWLLMSQTLLTSTRKIHKLWSLRPSQSSSSVSSFSNVLWWDSTMVIELTWRTPGMFLISQLCSFQLLLGFWRHMPLEMFPSLEVSGLWEHSDHLGLSQRTRVLKLL